MLDRSNADGVVYQTSKDILNMPPHTKMEKTPHFAHWASAVNIVKKHPLCVNSDFELNGLNSSINKTTFWVLGDFREVNHYNYLVQNR